MNLIDNSEYKLELEKVKKSIEKLTDAVKDANDLNKLYTNETFKKVILDGLFKDEVNKLTQSLALDPHTKDSEELIMVRLRGLKVLRNYLNGRKESGKVAKMNLEQEEQYQQELLDKVYGANNDN